ncbi:MAG: shikimate dehydrogenase [Actinomycetota bacterium]
MISGRTRFAGILAGPVQAGHSLSPAIHNAAFRALGLDWIYLGFGVESGRLAEAVKGLAAAGVRGLNVTMPHKIVALDLVDELTEQANLIGAINTIELSGGRLIGHNTDVTGLARFVSHDLGISLAGCKALVIGSGGSARAAVATLCGAGAGRVVVLARSAAAAEALRAVAGSTPFEAQVLDERAFARVAESEVVVHCTPVGQQLEEPVIPPEYISKQAVVVDLVYRPPVTPLISAARARGAVAHSGLGMLVNQAALAFEIWTGLSAPMEAMSAAALRELSKPAADSEPS